MLHLKRNKNTSWWKRSTQKGIKIPAGGNAPPKKEQKYQLVETLLSELRKTTSR
jgi:hypothetical protein